MMSGSSDALPCVCKLISPSIHENLRVISIHASLSSTFAYEWWKYSLLTSYTISVQYCLLVVSPCVSLTLRRHLRISVWFLFMLHYQVPLHLNFWFTSARVPRSWWNYSFLTSYTVSMQYCLLVVFPCVSSTLRRHLRVSVWFPLMLAYRVPYLCIWILVSQPRSMTGETFHCDMSGDVLSIPSAYQFRLFCISSACMVSSPSFHENIRVISSHASLSSDIVFEFLFPSHGRWLVKPFIVIWTVMSYQFRMLCITPVCMVSSPSFHENIRVISSHASLSSTFVFEFLFLIHGRWTLKSFTVVWTLMSYQI